MNLDLRRLELRDLAAIERIERESYPTPWSRSMFASELAKPSSLSLGAFDRKTSELLGYLVISRYVDAWHVMNVAVAPATAAAGSRARSSTTSSSRRPGTGGAATRSRCASRTRARSSSTRRSASAHAASGAATTPTTARTP